MMAQSKERLKKLLPGAALLTLVCAYFISESVLRIQCYRAPQGTGAATEGLLKQLPDFFQNYFRSIRKRAELKEQLSHTKSRSRRIDILYDLVGEHPSESKKRELMQQIVDEAGNSARSLLAWRTVLEDWEASRIIDEYLAYVDTCDIRSHRDKLLAWHIGLNAIKKTNDQDALRAYLTKMANYNVCDGSLRKDYEYLWVNAGAAGDDKTARTAKDLKEVCSNMAVETFKELSNAK